MQKQEILTGDETVEIRGAMDKLGWGSVMIWASHFENVGHRRWAVMCRGKCQGIYDLNRHTFVD